jgi:hypothetical protein
MSDPSPVVVQYVQAGTYGTWKWKWKLDFDKLDYSTFLFFVNLPGLMGAKKREKTQLNFHILEKNRNLNFHVFWVCLK